MRKNITLFLCQIIIGVSTYAQTDKDQLALEVSKVDTDNTTKLKEYVWKFHADVVGEGGNKTTLISEFQYDEAGELNMRLVDGETNIEKKPGLRGKMQQNAIESKLKYVASAMRFALSYTYMSKGQLLDFFNKAEVMEKGGIITATGKNVYVDGDELTIKIDAASKLYLGKSFSTKMNNDPISGEVQYDTFQSSGVNHITTTKFNMPAENVSISGMNKDYTIRID